MFPGLVFCTFITAFLMFVRFKADVLEADVLRLEQGVTDQAQTETATQDQVEHGFGSCPESWNGFSIFLL
jgi:hypothetical protein